jgi:hypothetical protein
MCPGAQGKEYGKRYYGTERNLDPPVERTGETVQGGGKGEEGVREGRADEVAGVGRDVAALVVRVDGDVQPHEVDELLGLSEAEEGSEVGRVVLVGVNGGELSVAVDVAEDASGNVGELSDEVHRVVERGLPVLLLVDTVRVRLGKGRVVVEGGDGEGELAHGVKGVGASVDELLDELGDGGTGGPLLGETLDLLLGRDLAGEEEPEETLGKGLGASGSLRELGLALRDGLAAETDTLVGVEHGALPNEALEVESARVWRVQRVQQVKRVKP